MTNFPIEILHSSGSKILEQTLSAETIHKYASVGLGISSIIENLTGVVDHLSPLLIRLPPTATFGEQFLLLGPSLFYIF